MPYKDYRDNKYFINKIADTLYTYIFEPTDKVGAKRSRENFIGWCEKYNVHLNDDSFYSLYWYNEFISDDYGFRIESRDYTKEGIKQTNEANKELNSIFLEFLNVFGMESEENFGEGGTGKIEKKLNFFQRIFEKLNMRY